MVDLGSSGLLRILRVDLPIGFASDARFRTHRNGLIRGRYCANEEGAVAEPPVSDLERRPRAAVKAPTVSALHGRVLAVYCFLCAIWGSTWLVIKIGLQYLPPLSFAGLLQIGVAYALIFVAQQWIESGLSALLFATFPLWVGLLAHFFIENEPLTARTLAAAALGLAR